MPRSLWTGSLSFGLVNVPVALFSGVARPGPALPPAATPRTTRRRDPPLLRRGGHEVPYDEIANGYETDDGEMVILTDAELAAAAPHRSRTIDIEAFVDLDDVDPISFDHPYVLMPSGEAEGIQRAYRMLVEVMSRTERAALGRVVMRTKEYLALIRARDERLVLDHAALARRGPPHRPDPRADQEGQARQEGGRRSGRADRVLLLRLGPLPLRGHLPEAPAPDRQAQGQGPDDRGPRRRGRAALAGARPHGRPRALARGGASALTSSGG